MWLDGFEDVTYEHSPGGTHAQPIRGIGVHTTEGATINGAFVTYAGNPHICPNATADPVTLEKAQHIDTDRSSYALQHGDTSHLCTVETNRSGIVQVEIVAFAYAAHAEQLAEQYPRYAELYRSHIAGRFSDETLRWIGEAVIAPILAAHPTIPHAVYSGPRMTETEWAAWPGGVCGHMHVPCQPDMHSDPGELDIGKILDFAVTSIRPPILKDDDMVILVAAKSDGSPDVDQGAFAYNGTHLRWVNDGNEYEMLVDDIKAAIVPVSDVKMRAVIASTAKVGGAPTSGRYAHAW